MNAFCEINRAWQGGRREPSGRAVPAPHGHLIGVGAAASCAPRPCVFIKDPERQSKSRGNRPEREKCYASEQGGRRESGGRAVPAPVGMPPPALLSQPPQNNVNLMFELVIINNKLTILWGN